jgi:sirohydrochlorin ferrochelatase
MPNDARAEQHRGDQIDIRRRHADHDGQVQRSRHRIDHSGAGVLHAYVREGESERLRRLNAEVARIAEALARLRAEQHRGDQIDIRRRHADHDGQVQRSRHRIDPGEVMRCARPGGGCCVRSNGPRWRRRSGNRRGDRC